MTATHESRAEGGRYSAVSMVLHWLIAALVIGQVAGGIYLDGLPRGEQKTAVFGLHFSLGITILALSLVRLGWRLGHPAPPLPASYPGWQRVLARGTHVMFYLFLIGMPLSGWLMVSGRGSVPDVWGAIPWFPLPSLGEGAGRGARFLHTSVGPLLFFGLFALHVAGALKHQFVDRDGTLARMLPGGRVRPAG